MTSETARSHSPAPRISRTQHTDPRPHGLSTTFAALRNHDYRLFFGGSLLSNIGMWMQSVAQGWLVVTLTDSEFLVGLVGFCAMAPGIFLSLIGGVLADRRDKRHILIAAQALNALLVALLATLIHTGQVQLWHIMVISLGTGTVMALTAPSWQAIVPEIVGKQNLLNAVALNSAQFNLTRVVGPSIAGILIRYVGIAGAYYLNALSFLPFLIALIFIRPQHSMPRSHGSEGVVSSLRAALGFVWRHDFIRTIVLLAVVQTLFLFPYITLLPIFAKHTLGMGAGGYGLLLSAAGVGAFLGAILLAVRGHEFENKGRAMLICQLTFAVGVAVFAFSHWLVLSLVALFCIGWSLVTFLAMGNTLLQTMTPDELRGRVMSIWMLAGFGLMPLGSLQAGAVASLTTPTIALAAGSVITLLVTGVVVLREWLQVRRQARPRARAATV